MLTPGRLRAATIAALGAGVFAPLGLHLPFLLGPLAACIVAATLGPLIVSGLLSMTCILTTRPRPKS